MNDLVNLHQFCRTGQMKSYRSICLCELKPILQEFPHELCGLIQFDLGNMLLHPVQTWTLVAHYRIFSMLRGFPERILQLSCLFLRDFRKTLAFPDGTAAKRIHILRIYHLITRLLKQLSHLLGKRFHSF